MSNSNSLSANSYGSTQNESQNTESFFTVIGCMDGRCVDPVEAFGRKKYNAQYSDYITDAGIVGIIASNPSEEFLDSLKTKIMISLEKHHSQGILVDGHAECAGDPVDDSVHKDHIRKTVSVISEMINSAVPVKGVFVKRSDVGWVVEEVPQTLVA